MAHNFSPGEKLEGYSYNPNRFNAVDSALVYILTLVAFTVVPYGVRLFSGIFRQVYLKDTFAYMIINIVISQAIILFVPLVWCKIRKCNPFEGGGYTARWDGVQFSMAMVLTMGVMMTFTYVHTKLGDDASLFVSANDPQLNQSTFSGVYAIVYIILSAVVPAIVEELLCRGVIMRGLEQFGSVFAVICSAVMFSFLHGSFSQMLLQFIGGVAIASAVILTKNYLIGCVMHFFNNAFAVVYGILSESGMTEIVVEYGGSARTAAYVAAVTDAACIVIGVICLFVGVIYFSNLAFVRMAEKKGWKKVRYPAEAKTHKYKMTADGEATVEEKVCYEAPELLPRKVEDHRLFLIGGFWRRLNKKASPAISLILIAAGIALAFLSVIGLF